jgi:hypothetical protein
MEYFFVPTGTKCMSAEIAQAIVSQPRFPFDWCQMNEWSMKKVIELDKESVSGFWQMYFSEIDDLKYHKITKSWFPHDSFTNEKEMEMTIAKYTRRTERFLNILKEPAPKIFFIAFGFPEENSAEKVNVLYHALSQQTLNNCFFIICNALILEEDKEVDNMYFFYIKLENQEASDLANWKELVTKSREKVHQILQKKNIKVIPFVERGQ